MSLIRKHGAVLQAWACLDLVVINENSRKQLKKTTELSCWVGLSYNIRNA